jgi:subtilisin family serine protease
VGILSADQVRYTIVKPTEYFDVVVPDRSRVQISAASVGREVLNPSKVEADCAEILKDPTVTSCEPDVWERIQAVPNDPYFNAQWHLRDTSHSGDVSAATAWEYGTGDSSTIVGVLDTGIYQAHPELSPNLWTNPSDPVDGIDNDRNGYIDDVHGANTALVTGNPEDLDGHGSHVSGIIAARGNNGAGVSGVMWQASVVVVSAVVDNSGWFSRDGIISGFNYFYDLKIRGDNVRVVNASFGSSSYSLGIYTAISRLRSVGVLVVAAAGNEHANNDVVASYPANYDLDNIISVAATGWTRRIASYSNYGQNVDIAAPGGDADLGGESSMVYSTYSSNVAGGSNYRYLQGTSMAAPVVTGAIGLLASQRPTLTGAELKALLLSYADSLPQLTSYVKDGKYLNVGAMAASAGGTDSCPEDPNKVRAGVCGCGVADTDSDADGTADCLDGCVADRDKTTPGSCGCGLSDEDADGNGTLDCRDPQISGVVPPTPSLRSAKGKIAVTMTSRAGVKYFLKVVVQEPKREKTPKAKTTYYSSDAATITISKLKSKSKVTISYSYYYQGTKTVSSGYSAARSSVVK